MTRAEIVAGLRRAAAICIEQLRCDWYALSVCKADAVFLAAFGLCRPQDALEGVAFISETWFAHTPEHAANFLLLAAEVSA